MVESKSLDPNLIPQEKTEAVARALSETFGVTPFEDIRRITGGHSPGIHVFRVAMHGRPYLLRIIMRAEDPTRHFTNMKAAAEAGLAPHVLYTNIEDKLAITDFVNAIPFPAMDALIRMPALLRKLHELPPFAKVPDNINTSCMFLLNKGPALDGLLQKFHSMNLLPKAENDELFARYEQVAAVYRPHDSDMVSSHNDLFKPDNILFDGNRVWLVDWEAAFLNDRYADLAVVANQIVTNEKEESVFLHEYFGKSPDEYQRARFFLMQQIAHIFYTIAFLFAGSAGKSTEQPDVPEYHDFQQRFWSGEIKLDDAPTKIAYAKVHLAKLLHDTQLPRFREALEKVKSSL